MENDILLNIESKEIRYAHLKNGQLFDLIIERKKIRQLKGNIYRGRVTNILRNIQSAFINIDERENGFIHISDVLENSKKFEQMFDMDFDVLSKENGEKPEAPIEELLKLDSPVLVQVVKEPIGTKGARLTSNISIPGRYLVLLPNSPHRGVSRKIEDPHMRDQLKQLIRSFEMPQDMGLICRTASTLASTDALINEAHDLLATWKGILEKFHSTDQPCLLYEETDILKKAVITCIDKNHKRLLIDDYSTYQKCKRMLKKYSPDSSVKIEYYRDSTPMFERFNIEKEIDKATKRKIWLSSGGYLFFDKTEAMHTIDVNSGRSTQLESGVEETLVQINLEAAEEIARQLRLRNVGGLVIIDFIDMKSRKNQRRVLERLKEHMKYDAARCTILSMSEFGLVEMTRQRNRESLMQTLFTTCPYCSGNAIIKTPESVVIEIERDLKKVINHKEHTNLCLVVHPEIANYMKQEKDDDELIRLAKHLKAKLQINTSDSLHLNHYQFFSLITGESIEL
ncbi:ribonuclease G/E [Chlamydia felis Fe/C-56]|uniref:Ribonuclease G n=1 Tax=Chlamydia felis (strain Fe/C-56) TaxID=264202 RepID=Q255R1_CHLFF|nr:Rne/Rng family ribonuclease [Chlamydia felis]BAE80977.1 ribonuclease G/E [Chlamydia felis Fe/C-56]